MKKRLFIAIPIPNDVKDRVAEALEPIKDRLGNNLPWIPDENWHLTLTFLGWQEETEMEKITAALRETAGKSVKPHVEFDAFRYGPTDARARMVWLTTMHATSQAIGKIKNDLEDALWERGVRWERETRQYTGHLTFVRFSESAPILRQAQDKLLPEFCDDFTAETLTLFESHLSRSGATYTNLAQTPFASVV
jgi:2'-5' RNA ligase